MIKYMTWFQCIFKHDTRKRTSLDRMSFHSFGQGILYINTQVDMGYGGFPSSIA